MLYGRSHDCAELSELLSAAQRGDSRAIVLRGEAGVGKTALLDWFAEQTEQQHAALLRCAGVESEADLPFAALHQLLRPAISAMPALPRLQQEALNGALGLSGRRGSDPFLVAVAALSLLGEIAADNGLACIVDDAQWLDPSSADVLRFVARRLDADGVVLVLAVRDPSDASFPSAGLPESRLHGLDTTAASSLLVERAPMISAEVQSRLVQHHAGNPLAIIELAPLLTDGQLAGREPLPDPMPMGGEVERLYAARAAELGEGAQRLLLLAATADTAELGLVLAAAASIGVPAEALEEAERSGLISAGRGVLRFKHPLVRSAIYQHSSFLDRQRGHEAMAGLLTSEAEADRRAWHLVRAATGLDDALADLLEASAGRALSRGGPAAAVDRWQWAAEFSTAGESRCRRLLMAAQTAFHAAQPERARQLLAAARVLATSPREQGEITALEGCIEVRHGAPEAAYDLLLTAARQLAPHDAKAALEALVLAGEAATFLGEPRRTSEVGVLADELRHGADADDLTKVDLLVGLAKLFEGNWSDSSEILARVIDQPVDDAHYAHALRSGRAALYVGRLTAARELYARAATHARESGMAGQIMPMLERLGYIELLLNRLRDSEAHALEAIRLADALELDAGVAMSSLATVHAYRGEESACRSRARDHLRNALTAFERLGAAPWADRARTELRATGETTRPRDASGLDQLTPQELQIAQYAGAGESNADIAAKLFLSRRTVEYHLGKVYTKVGVTSRRELTSTVLVRH